MCSIPAVVKTISDIGIATQTRTVSFSAPYQIAAPVQHNAAYTADVHILNVYSQCMLTVNCLQVSWIVW